MFLSVLDALTRGLHQTLTELEPVVNSSSSIVSVGYPCNGKFSVLINAKVSDQLNGSSESGKPTFCDEQSGCVLQLPADARKCGWFTDAFECLTAVNLGEDYIALVEKWTALERTNRWATSRLGLTKAGRPTKLSKWIRNSRKQTSEPDLSGDLIKFTNSVWDWWLRLQPSWRCATTKDQLKPIELFGDDWQTLNVCGKNGWLCLLVTLKWWGTALLHQSGDEREGLQDDWLRAVHDISMMLDGLLRYRNTHSN